MKLNDKYRLLFLCVTIGLLFIISACGNKESSEAPDKQDKDTSSEVTLDSEKGEVTMPKEAKHVIAPYHEDTLLALGITPVAKWAIGKSVQGYLEPELKDVPSIEWNLPLEQVLNQDPDLIILENNLDSYKGSYEDYNKIAPTYVMNKETTDNWQKQLETFGKLFGKEDKAKEVLKQYKDKVAKASEEVKDAIGDETAAVIWVSGDEYFVFEHNRHSAEVLYSELGVKVPALIEELGDAETAWNPMSIEKLSELDADHVFLLAEKGESGVETLNKSTVWQSTPAVKKGNVYHLQDPSNWTNQGLLASEKTIDDIVKALKEK
ncbi:iron-hydroxamate ABC transporter substrate-binding protein [Lentibacillus sp. L22]|uniref:iron-hydroxamate ABC transporter substrate-binding protein n=1 Tax=Lentibacillus TaxID=175304 RepID=UPI0022B0D164|nr:iron-hydroxamate ABC transporter substrate-binding protein [Lentibacillus daqui]